MASSADPWVREYNEASKLSDDITNMISARSSYGSGPEAQRHSSAIRRKITILGTRLDSLQSLLTKLPAKQPLTEKEMNRRRDMLTNMRTKVTQMASTLNMSNFANRDSLLGPDTKPADVISRTAGLDNSGIVGLQRQDDLDEHVDVTNSRLKRVQKNLAILNKRAKGGCSCLCMLLSVIGIVGLVLAIYMILKYL
ncbi:hypothetical protein M8C21_031302 [Ambrosia artemisiifolia]|uniref:t-SNARE coiled-coil homology domain-containing protein n=1 Tax=Ambrosia artemisiifolia TaxID=4212 RepID=A0AAD5G793_AMBAR|nr:hypothetical protein M8C21_031302 [Ambrosia artemisiifolia]